MLEDLNLTGIRIGSSPLITVSQVGVMASYRPPVWGGGGDAGALGITVQRSSLQVAPDSVDFWPDLTNTTFDTPAPTGGRIYDRRQHEIIYIWDMGDTAPDWTKPVKGLPAWKDRNAAKGHFVKHMYSQPGTYSPMVIAYEPSSGKSAMAILDGGDAITVADPDIVYGGVGPNRGLANTICISTSGNFAGAPAGAAQVTATDINAALLAEYGFNGSSWDGAKRFLFRHDETFNLAWDITLQADGWIMGRFGGSGYPTLNIPAVVLAPPYAGKIGLLIEGSFGSGTDVPDARVTKVKFKGTWNPVTTDRDNRTLHEYAIWARRHCNLMLSDVLFEGIDTMAVNMNYGQTEQGHLHIDDCLNNEVGGDYSFFYPKTSNANGSAAMTGCQIATQPDAINDGGSKEIIRVTSCPNFHGRGNDTYHTCHERVHYRVNGAAMGDGYIVNVHSNAMEGGAGAFTIAGNMSDSLGRSPVFNAIYDGNVWVGHYAGAQFLDSRGTGITIRNNMGIMPLPYDSRTPNPLLGWIKLTEWPGYDPVIVGEAPIWTYNNSFVSLRSNAQNNNKTTELFYYGGGSAVFTRVEEHNLLHQPNMASGEDAGPLATDVLWTPRNPGLRLKPVASPSTTLGSSVVNNATIFVPYWTGPDGNTITQADMASESENAYVQIGVGIDAVYYREGNGDIAVTFGATGITYQNTSGTTWASGDTATYYVNYSPPLITTDHVTPADAVKSYRPLSGSPAYQTGAATGAPAKQNIGLEERGAPDNMGAW